MRIWKSYTNGKIKTIMNDGIEIKYTHIQDANGYYYLYHSGIHVATLNKETDMIDGE